MIFVRPAILKIFKSAYYHLNRNLLNSNLQENQLITVNQLLGMLRNKKKSQFLVRNVEQESRGIISGIFKELRIVDEQLECSKQLQKRFFSQQTEPKQVIEMQKIKQKNEHTLFPFLSLFIHPYSKGMHLIVPHLIKFHPHKIEIIYTGSNGQVAKADYDHLSVQGLKKIIQKIYFSKLDFNIDLMHEESHNKIIHLSEEAQESPSIIKKVQSNKKQFTKIYLCSNDLLFRRNGSLQNQIFCNVIFKNKSQQIFSYSQIRTYLDYSTNLKDFEMIKFVVRESSATKMYYTTYKHQNLLSNHKNVDLLMKIRSSYQKKEGFQKLNQEIEVILSGLLKQKKYQEYAEAKTLQIVSFLLIDQNIQVQSIKLEWIINQQIEVVLNEVHLFEYSKLKSTLHIDNTQGLMTLYAKFAKNKSNYSQNQRNFSFFESGKRSRKSKKVHSEPKCRQKSSSKIFPSISISKSINLSSEKYLSADSTMKKINQLNLQQKFYLKPMKTDFSTKTIRNISFLSKI